jgi:hypothetical protein
LEVPPEMGKWRTEKSSRPFYPCTRKVPVWNPVSFEKTLNRFPQAFELSDSMDERFELF